MTNSRSALSRVRNGLVVAAATALALAGCASGGGTAEETPESNAEAPVAEEADDNGETLRIAFVPGISSDPFFVAMEIAAEEEAEALGVELLYQGSSSDYSPQAQLPFVEGMIADNVDGLIIAATDADALQSVVDRALDDGILVATVDTTVGDQSRLVTHVTGDNLDGGAQAADTMAELLGGSGEVFVISGSPTITTDTMRVEGFTDRIEAEYPEIEIIGIDHAYSQPAEATTKVGAALLNNPNLGGIFAVEGNSGVGAVAALRDAGLTDDVALIGYDAYPNQVEELREGIYSALVAQQPGEQARIALRAMVAALRGEESDIGKEVIVENVIMTQENLGETEIYTYAEK